MSIGLVMPSMRPDHAVKVIEDLDSQLIKPDYLLLVDNGHNLNFLPKFSFNLEIIRPEENIGTNAVWNMLLDSKYFPFDYVGMVGDDYRLSDNCIEELVKTLDLRLDDKPTGMAGTSIVKGRNKPEVAKIISHRVIGKAKGHMGLVLMKREFADILPCIPKEFFIFFGDDWWSFWVNYLGYNFVKASVPITHYHKTDLKEKLGYRKVIEKERILWKEWLRGKRELC